MHACGFRLGLGGDVPAVDPTPPANPLDGGVPPHATFIAGLVRQLCPEARLQVVPVFDDAGTMPEGALLEVLNLLLVRQWDVLAGRADTDDLIDVLSLSLGYYHEDPDDALEDAPLRLLLDEFGRAGVAVVASAGNQATTEPLYPAAFAGHTQPFNAHCVPLVSVGALNPDLRTTAYFSNAGDWVSCQRAGAALVSTVPVDLNGELQAGAALTAVGQDRATIDPEDFSGGFATWSGTSFAGPVLAAQLAARLVADDGLAEVDPAAAVKRGWSAVTAELGWTP